MFTFSIRDLFWLTTLIAVGLAAGRCLIAASAVQKALQQSNTDRDFARFQLAKCLER